MAAAGQTVRPVKGLKKEQQHSRVLVWQGTTGKDVDRNSPHKLHQVAAYETNMKIYHMR